MRKTIVSVQAVRAFAAMTVAIAHFHHEFIQPPGTTSRWFGEFGVDLFFVISGFIMVYVSWDYFGANGAAAEFIKRRLARIVPIYWLATTAMLGFIVYTQPLKQADLDSISIIASYFFIPVPRPSGAIIPALTVGWTLNYEMMFYVLFAASLFFRRWLGIVLITGLLAAMVLQRKFGTLGPVLNFWTKPIIIEFAAGILLGALYCLGSRINRAVALAIFATGSAIAIYANASGVWYEHREYWFGSAAALIIGGLVFARLEWSGAPLLVATSLGNSSYALYLIHPFFLIWPKFFLIQNGIGIPTQNWPFLFAMLISSIVLSLLAYRYFESPILGLILKKHHGPNWKRDATLSSAT